MRGILKPEQIQKMAPLIERSASGDSLATEELMTYYAGYLRKQATRTLYDAAGQLYSFLDMDKLHELEQHFRDCSEKFKL